MPTFYSDRGIWHAAKERVGGLIYQGTKSIPKSKLPSTIKIAGDTLNPGDPLIYDGADREALKLLNKEGYNLKGEQVMGKDFRNDPDFLQAVRNMQFNNLDEYLKSIGYDDEEQDKQVSERAIKTKSHEVPKRVREITELAGGKNFAGGADENLIGGFGQERPRKASEAKK